MSKKSNETDICCDCGAETSELYVICKCIVLEHGSKSMPKRRCAKCCRVVVDDESSYDKKERKSVCAACEEPFATIRRTRVKVKASRLRKISPAISLVITMLVVIAAGKVGPNQYVSSPDKIETLSMVALVGLVIYGILLLSIIGTVVIMMYVFDRAKVSDVDVIRTKYAAYITCVHTVVSQITGTIVISAVTDDWTPNVVTYSIGATCTNIAAIGIAIVAAAIYGAVRLMRWLFTIERTEHYVFEQRV